MAKDVYLRFKKELEQRDLKVKAAQEAEEKRKEEEYKNSYIAQIKLSDIFSKAKPDPKPKPKLNKPVTVIRGGKNKKKGNDDYDGDEQV